MAGRKTRSIESPLQVEEQKQQLSGPNKSQEQVLQIYLNQIKILKSACGTQEDISKHKGEKVKLNKFQFECGYGDGLASLEVRIHLLCILYCYLLLSTPALRTSMAGDCTASVGILLHLVCLLVCPHSETFFPCLQTELLVSTVPHIFTLCTRVQPGFVVVMTSCQTLAGLLPPEQKNPLLLQRG